MSTNIIPRGNFNPRNVASNLSKTRNGFNFSNVGKNMNSDAMESCNHQWAEKTLKVIRDGRGHASKMVEMRCLICGLMVKKKMNYSDMRIYD